MTDLLIRLFIRHPQDTKSAGARLSYGRMAGSTGLCANILLFLIKLLAGLLTASVAITADAFNNLSDAGSSVVTLVGFKLSSAPPDKEHPFGHGRMEYLTAMAIAIVIVLAGFELAKSSVDKILHPTVTDFTVLSILILVIAVGVKLWMAFFYRKIGVLIDSEALKAAMTDSRNDVLCTSFVLICSVFSMLTGIQIDGYVGIAVAVFVMWSGFSVLRKMASPLLGEAPNPAMVEDIRKTVLEHDGIVGVHDLIVHNYGPGRCIISLHAEVPSDADVMSSHDVIDCIEKEIMGKYNAVSCIHMDPIDTKDERVGTLRALLKDIVKDIDSRLEIHDFRVVFGTTHTNVIFDLVIPFDYKGKIGLNDEVQRRVREMYPNIYVVATVEYSYT